MQTAWRTKKAILISLELIDRSSFKTAQLCYGPRFRRKTANFADLRNTLVIFPFPSHRFGTFERRVFILSTSAGS